MSNPERQSKPPIERSEQNIQNWSFDNEYNVLAVEMLAENPAGDALVRLNTSDLTGGSTTYDIRDIEDTGTYKYFGFGERGGTAWRIMRKELATNAFRYATGATDYATNWTNRGSQTYV